MGLIITDFFRDGEFSDEYDQIYKRSGFGDVPARSRGPFVMYLYAVKGFSNDDLKAMENGTSNITVEEKIKMYDDFMALLNEKPIEKPFDKKLRKRERRSDAGENSRILGKWFHEAVKTIKEDSCPKADNIKTPKDAIEYLNNFNYIRFYSKDIVQEYEHLWLAPDTRGPVVYEMGDEEMAYFSKVEALDGAVASLKGLFTEDVPPKFQAMYYPLVRDFINEVAGKSFKDLDMMKLNKYFQITNLMLANKMNFGMDVEKDDPKYTRFLETGEADFDVEDIKLISGFSGQEQNIRENWDEVDVIANGVIAHACNRDTADYSKNGSVEKVNSLIQELPDFVEYRVDAPEEERKKVSNVFMNTFSTMYGYYNNSITAYKGKKTEELIKINGRTISSIIDEKYADANLTPEQRKTALEYEFVAAVSDERVNIEYTPYKFDKDTGEIVPDKVIKVTTIDKIQERKYDVPVNKLMSGELDIYGKDLKGILNDAENIYHKLYNDSNRLTDSSEFKRMLGSFKELHEVYQTINEIGIEDNMITDNTLNEVQKRTGYTKDMLSNLLKETAKNCDTYITEKNASGRYRSSEKGNDRLMCAVGFLTDLDERRARTNFRDLKLKDALGKKVVKEDTNDDSKVKMSFNDLMDDGENIRKNVAKNADNNARVNKKRMHQRSGREM